MSVLMENNRNRPKLTDPTNRQKSNSWISTNELRPERVTDRSAIFTISSTGVFVSVIAEPGSKRFLEDDKVSM